MNRSRLLFFIAAGITAFSFFIHSHSLKLISDNDELSEQRLERNRDRMAPYEYFNVIRNYPEYSLDEQGFKNALIQLQNNRSRYAKSGELNNAWTTEGPTNIGGSITCIAVHPTDTQTIFIGSVNGGIYKTSSFSIINPSPPNNPVPSFF